MKVLIIEDELPAAKRLINLINEVDPSLTVIGQLDSVEQAVTWFRANKMPDLVFLDIQLADGQSFNIFEQVEIMAPIIFTTAYDEYALEAFKVNSIDYLLKPIQKEDLKKSLEKLNVLRKTEYANLVRDMEGILRSSRAASKYKTRFLIRQKDQLMTVEDRQVAYLKASGKLVLLITFENRQFVLDDTLESYASLVDPDRFFRLNRSILASRGSIEKILTHYNGKLKIELRPDAKEEIFVSREKASAFREWLES